jgi:hypothetical protein
LETKHRLSPILLSNLESIYLDREPQDNVRHLGSPFIVLIGQARTAHGRGTLLECGVGARADHTQLCTC